MQRVSKLFSRYYTQRVEIPFTPSHVPMQYVQPTATEFYDPNQQQLCVPQQMQQLQQWDVCLQSNTASTTSKCLNSTQYLRTPY